MVRTSALAAMLATEVDARTDVSVAQHLATAATTVGASTEAWFLLQILLQ